MTVPDDEEAAFAEGFYGEPFARFEALGEDSISRMLWSGGIAERDREAALIWLGGKARESSLIAAKRLAFAERQCLAAERANTKANIALIIAIISAASPIISIIFKVMGVTVMVMSIMAKSS